MGLRSWLYKTAKTLGDVNAVQKGKVGKRIGRRAAGRVAGSFLRNLFKQAQAYFFLLFNVLTWRG